MRPVQPAKLLDGPEYMPIFTLYTSDGEINIYANGIVEGCKTLAGIANFIPCVASDQSLRRFSKPWQSLQSPTISFSEGSAVGTSQAETSISV